MSNCLMLNDEQVQLLHEALVRARTCAFHYPPHDTCAPTKEFRSATVAIIESVLEMFREAVESQEQTNEFRKVDASLSPSRGGAR